MLKEPFWTRLVRSSNLRRYRLGPLAIFVGLTWVTGVGAVQLAPGVTDRSVPVSELLGRSASEVRSRIGARTPDHDYVSEVRLTPTGEVVMRADADVTRGGGFCASKSGLRFMRADSPIFPRFIFQYERLQEIRDLNGDSIFPADQLITVRCVPVIRGDPVQNMVALLVFGPWAAASAAAHTPESVARARIRAELAMLRLGQPPPRGLAAFVAHPPAGVQVQAQTPGRVLLTFDLGRDETTKRSDLVRAEVADGRIVALSKAPLNFVPCWIEPDRALHCGDTAAPL